jgi:TonB family protein
MLNTSINRGSLAPGLKLVSVVSVLALLLPIAAIKLPAQNAAKFYGTIHDISGRPVPNATVSMIEKSKIVMTASDTRGNFAFESLPAGEYEVKIWKRGFEEYKAQQILDVARDSHRDITLAVPVFNEEVEVVAEGNPKGRAVSGSAGGAIQAPKLINKVQPVYPSAAKAAGSQGTVILHAIIGMDGTPLSLQVVNDQIDPELARAAIESVSKWRYSPTLLNGNPIEVDTTIQVNFTLQPSAESL